MVITVHLAITSAKAYPHVADELRPRLEFTIPLMNALTLQVGVASHGPLPCTNGIEAQFYVRIDFAIEALRDVLCEEILPH